jgi:hypothetical protein
MELWPLVLFTKIGYKNFFHKQMESLIFTQLFGQFEYKTHLFTQLLHTFGKDLFRFFTSQFKPSAQIISFTIPFNLVNGPSLPMFLGYLYPPYDVSRFYWGFPISLSSYQLYHSNVKIHFLCATRVIDQYEYEELRFLVYKWT